MLNKHAEERFFKFLMLLSISFVLFLLISVVFAVAYRGLPSLSLEMLTQAPKGGFYTSSSGGGGILNAIIGSLYLAGASTLLAFIISLPVVLFLNIYLKQDSKFAAFIRLAMDVLWGVPSIVFGAFAFSIMIFIGMKTSLLAGIVILSILILPVIIRAMDEIMKLIPLGLVEASLSLGATRWETSFKIVVRQALPGITTAILLAFGRAIGDAASVIFTAGYTDRIPTSLMKPAASLPLNIFIQLSTPIKEVQNRAYASAVILTLIILIVSIASRILYKKYDKNRII
jgi:phosphate transport system permease protein